MLLNRVLVVGILFSSLIGCQSVKFGRHSSEEAIAKKDSAELAAKQTSQLLSGLADKAQLSFSLEDENAVQEILEANFTNQPSKWRGTHGELEVTPTKTFEKEKGKFCREYQTKLIDTSKEISVNSLACRQQNGLWIRQ